MYGLDNLAFESIFAGPPPQFGESQRKQAAVLGKAKKGQVTLDSWIKVRRKRRINVLWIGRKGKYLGKVKKEKGFLSGVTNLKYVKII